MKVSARSSTKSWTWAVCFSLISRAKTLRASRISGTSSTTTPAGRCSRASSGTSAAPSPAGVVVLDVPEIRLARNVFALLINEKQTAQVQLFVELLADTFNSSTLKQAIPRKG